jgi:predicted transcriptional regulator
MKKAPKTPKIQALDGKTSETLGRPPPQAGNRWTFLTNHAHVLSVLHRNPNIVLREVAVKVGITERAVQRIVHDLESEGFIRVAKVGRRNQYDVITSKSLRHPIEEHRDIGDILKLIAKDD